MEEEDAQEIIDEVSDEDDGEGMMKKREETKSYNRADYIERDGRVGNTGLVSEAVTDLDKEINRIKSDKSALNLELNNLDQDLDNAQQLEKKLQEKIAMLEAKEAELISERKRLKQKGDSLGERLDKVKEIKDKLTEI
ncbi:hypothetical protein HY449_03350 [Candidatus Pacearchaeota archaeon]|nr:hypothetical protein [Candidatus Pacearchaeota archaeon]